MNDEEKNEGLNLLSAPEREVLQLIARGYNYRDVGEELHISIKTVESHLSSVFRKLQLWNRNEPEEPEPN